MGCNQRQCWQLVGTSPSTHQLGDRALSAMCLCLPACKPGAVSRAAIAWKHSDGGSERGSTRVCVLRPSRGQLNLQLGLLPLALSWPLLVQLVTYARVGAA